MHRHITGINFPQNSSFWGKITMWATHIISHVIRIILLLLFNFHLRFLNEEKILLGCYFWLFHDFAILGHISKKGQFTLFEQRLWKFIIAIEKPKRLIYNRKTNYPKIFICQAVLLKNSFSYFIILQFNLFSSPMIK